MNSTPANPDPTALRRMVNDESRIRDEVVDRSTKKLTYGNDSSKGTRGKSDISGFRRLAKETPCSQSVEKSKHCDIGKTSSSSSVKRKSERFEKHATLIPLRRSVSGKENLSSSCSDLKRCANELGFPEKMKENKLNQKTVESKKSEVQLETFCTKRKKMTGHTFKSMFKRKRITGPSKIIDSNLSHSSQRDSTILNSSSNHMANQSSSSPEVDTCEAEESSAPSDDWKSLHSSLQGEAQKLCEILQLSEDVTDTVRRFLEFVIFNHHFSRESPEIMEAFQISLCCIAASISKQKQVHKRESLVLAKKHLNYQCTEEQVHSVYSKMRDLESIFLQSSPNTTDSGKDCLPDEEDINKETSNAFPSCERKNVDVKIEEDSANGEDNEGLILSAKDKGAGSEIYNIVNKIQNKCNKRMKKLKLKHEKEIQEFDCMWEEKRLKLEKDHKLKSTVFRSIYGEGSATQKKLKELNDDLAKKMEENNLLKDLQLKNLEAQQLVAMNEEKEKQAHWLADAKSCSSSEQRDVCGTQSLGQQSEEDAEFSLSSLHRDLVSITADVAATEKAFGTTDEEGGCIAPIESPNHLVTINQENEVGVTSPERSQINLPKHFATGAIISSNMPSEERLSDEIRSVELTGEVQQEVPETIPNETADSVNTVDLSSGSNKGDAAGLPDALANQRDGTDGPTTCGLPLAGRSEEQTEASQNCCELVPQVVPDDEIRQTLASSELQDQFSQAAEKQNDLQSEVAPSEVIGTETVLDSNLEQENPNALANESQSTSNIEDANVADVENQDVPVLEDQGTSQLEEPNLELVGTETRMQSNVKALEQENPNAIANESQSTSNIEDANMEVIENQDVPVLEDQGTSQLEEPNLELVGTETRTQSNVQALEIDNCNVIDISPDQSPINEAQTAEALESDVLPTSRTGVDLELQGNNVSTVQLPNETQQGVNVGPFYDWRHPFPNPNHQVASWNYPSLFADPLEFELGKICKQTEHLRKSHNDMTSQLKSDCEKEIAEISAQIRNKYEMKLQDAVADFRLKKNGLDKNQNKVLMNKVLADTLRYRDSYPLEITYSEKSSLSSGLPQMQQAIPSYSMHQQHSTRSIQQMTSGIQQSARVAPVAPQHVQTMQHSAAGNLPFYPPAQHIQAFRPASASSTPQQFFPPPWLEGVPHLPSNLQNSPQL